MLGIYLQSRESERRSKPNHKEKSMKTRRLLFTVFSLLLVIAMLAGCAPKAAVTPAASAAAGGSKLSVPAAVLDPLVTACKAEGMLSIIATPASWANYG